jgi:hypothetical protein
LVAARVLHSPLERSQSRRGPSDMKSASL